MKLRSLFLAAFVVLAAGCFIASSDFSGAACREAGDCPKGGYLCVSSAGWPQKVCADGETGCICEVKFPPDPTSTDGGGPGVDAGPPPDAGNWCDDIRPLFLRSCVGTCHSSMPSWPNAPRDFRLDVYEVPGGAFPAVKDKLPRVKARCADSKDMPPVSELLAFPFSANERSLVDKWVMAGGPLGAGGCDVITTTDAGKTDGGTDAGVSFAVDVVPIFQVRCSPCHTTNTSGTLSLTAANAYTNLVGPNTTCNTAVKRVQPNATLNSMLWRKLTNAVDKCGNAMPNGTAGLSTTQPAEFQKIERWILQGAPNN